MCPLTHALCEGEMFFRRTKAHPSQGRAFDDLDSREQVFPWRYQHPFHKLCKLSQCTLCSRCSFLSHSFHHMVNLTCYILVPLAHSSAVISL